MIEADFARYEAEALENVCARLIGSKTAEMWERLDEMGGPVAWLARADYNWFHEALAARRLDEVGRMTCDALEAFVRWYVSEGDGSELLAEEVRYLAETARCTDEL